jgi:hypothetical protein
MAEVNFVKWNVHCEDALDLTDLQMESPMKRMIATTAGLFVLIAASNADAGIMYGNGVANRLSTGTGGFARFYRYLGQMEYRKDVWLFGRPLGAPPVDYCPQCGQPLSTHRGYHYSQPNGAQPVATPPAPTPAQPMPARRVKQPPTVFSVPPASNR